MLAMAAETKPALVRDWRCAGVKSNGDACRQKLAVVAVPHGSYVQIKCHRCGTINTIDKTQDVPAA
jgi:phage FluMu protein Com